MKNLLKYERDNTKKDIGRLVSLYEMLTGQEEVIHKILIPKIQRDYAQGRSGMEVMRRRFLDSIFEVIDKPTNNSIILDFVFGQKEVRSKNVFYPVDGQQRITTLFLLYFYVGKRAMENTDFLKSSVMKHELVVNSFVKDFIQFLLKV